MKEAKAIVYTSNTGYTAKYAHLLGEELGLGVYSSDEAKKALEKNTEIIYLGWLMAGSVKGYKEATKRWKVLALCGVGMAPNGAQDDQVRKAYSLEIPVFTLRGGYDHDRVTGIYKAMMNMLFRMVEKRGKKNGEFSEQDGMMLDMKEHGGDFVCVENLAPVLAWYLS